MQAPQIASPTAEQVGITGRYALMSDRDVAKLIGGSRATVWRRVADGTLPRPLKFGGLTRWLLSEVEAAIARQVAARDAEAA